MRAILVVDDDPDIRSFVCDLLAAEGYRVVAAGDGWEALSYLRGGHEPVLVLLDLLMPGLDGYRVLDELDRAPDLQRRCRLALMSASERLDMSAFPHADGLLAKPFEVADLLDLVDRLASDVPPALASSAAELVGPPL
jgi:CheY-like chemotaxis protein